MPSRAIKRNPLNVLDPTASLKDRPNWRHRAACLEENPELFFPIGDTEPALRQLHRAKQVCAGCPVREACLQWAVDIRQDHGVWGGLSAAERVNLIRRRARSARPTLQAVSVV